MTELPVGVTIVEEITYAVRCVECGQLAQRLTERQAIKVGSQHRCGEWKTLLGKHVKVVDVKHEVGVSVIGRTGTIRHDDVFDRMYLSFDDGGSADESHVIVEVIP